MIGGSGIYQVRVGLIQDSFNIYGGIFRGNCFRLKVANFFCKKLQFKMLPKNTFYVLLVKILHFDNKTRNIYACMLGFTFQKEDVID